MQEEVRRASEIASSASNYSITLAWISFVAALGGVVRVIREHKLESKTWKQVLWIFTSEMIVSCFVGVVTFSLCQAAGFNEHYTAALTSISGYMGGRSLSVLESIYKAVFRR